MTDIFVQTNRYRFFTIAAIGTFMGTLEGSILNVALPTIARDLDCTVDVIAWLVLAYSLTLVSLLMVFGVWTSRKGYAFAYKFGYSFFFVGSLVCALSGSFTQLVIGRVIQATGAAMFQAVGMGMITTVFPPNERGKVIGMMAMIVSSGLMSGPPLGGLLVSILPWQSIFYVNLPIGLLGLILSFRHFRSFRSPLEKRKMNLAGVLALSVGLLTGMLALSLVDDYSLADIRVVGLGVVCVVCLLAFFRFETSPGRAMIGLDIFKNRQFATGITATLLMFAAFSGVLILVPFYLQDVQGFQPRTIGLFLMLLPITMFVVAPLSGRLSDKIGYRLLTAGGLLTMAAGFHLLAGLQTDSSSGYIAGSLIVTGVGMGVFSSPNNSALMGSVSEQQRAVSSGILSTTRNIGMAVGVALSTALFSYFQMKYATSVDAGESFIVSYHNAIYVSIAFALIGSLVSLTRKNKLTG